MGNVSVLAFAVGTMMDVPPDVPRYTCPHCGAVSFNPNDLKYGFCGRCKLWKDGVAESVEPRNRGPQAC